MWFIWVGVAMIVLKVLDISVFSELSWWWVALPFGVGFLWFELVEKRLGMDKKKAFDEIDKAKKDRIKKRFETDKGLETQIAQSKQFFVRDRALAGGRGHLRKLGQHARRVARCRLLPRCTAPARFRRRRR